MKLFVLSLLSFYITIGSTEYESNDSMLNCQPNYKKYMFKSLCGISIPFGNLNGFLISLQGEGERCKNQSQTVKAFTNNTKIKHDVKTE